MDSATQHEFNKMHDHFTNLTQMMADGFATVDQRFAQVDERFEKLEVSFNELRSEIRSIRTELERLPDDIDATYSSTLNGLLDRVAKIEQQLGLPQAA